MTDKKEYEIGKCKPPKEHRFKKGTVPNPTGRPKGIVTFKERIRRLMNVEIDYENVEGETKKTKIGDALIASMAKKALHENDVAAAKLLIENLDGKPLQKTQDVPASLEDALKILDKEDKDD